jgi:AcrR family transcriptional regulator
VAAAARHFAEAGFDATNVRQIAADAGLDPAVVHDSVWSKEDLFTQVVAALIDPAQALATVAERPRDHAGERLLRHFLAMLGDIGQPGAYVGLVRSVMASEDAADLLRQFLAEMLHRKIAATLHADQPDLRVALAASHLVGLAVARHVIRLAPLTAADPEDLAAWIAPVLQNYLTGSHASRSQAPVAWDERFRLLLAEAIEQGSPTLGELARSLAVSVRTLQRRLAENGTTWRAELDTARERRARQAREDGPVDMARLARHLGYADARSVRRALRRWENDPGEPSREKPNRPGR